MQALSRRPVVSPSLLSGVVGSPWAWALALCLVVAPDPARAGAPAPTRLSAEAFLARVAESHPRLPLLEAAVEAASADVRAEGVWQNPVMSYEREEVAGAPENFVRLELPLEVSGRRGLRVEGAELGVEAARATSTRERSALLLEALGAYWSARAAGDSLEGLRREREALARLLEATRLRAAAGDISGYDLDRLELEVESLEDLIADAEREVEARQRGLGLLVGRPGARVAAGDALVLPSAPQALEGLGRQAVEARADHRAARLRVTQAERELAAARRGWVPELALTGGAKSGESANDETGWGYVAGLALGVPLFDRGQGEAARARAGLRRAQAEQRLMEAQAVTEVATAHDAFVRSLDQARRFERRQLPRLERLVRRAEVSYQEGERPVFELLDAYRTARELRLRRIELARQARLAELELLHALGLAPGEDK